MKATLKKILSSYVTTLILLSIYAIALALATFIEKYCGTPIAKSWIYYSPLLFLVQFLFVVNFVTATIQHQLIKKGKWGFLILHVAFIIILSGALVSFIFGEEGILHIREGESGNELIMQTASGNETHTLPFHVELLKFTITRYPGSNSPSSYESELLFHMDGKSINRRVFMNNVVDLKGYRFFQASYDKDEKGTILSVNRDVVGRCITYTGYFLLLIGFIGCLIGKNSRFRRLNRQLKELSTSIGKTVVVMLLWIIPAVSSAKDNTPMMKVLERYAVNPEHAAAFGSLPIQSGTGRMIPVNTFSSEILRKLHKSDKIGNLNSDQFLISLLAMPDMWMRIPIITYSSKEISAYYDLTEDECAYIEFFDENGEYKLLAKLEESYNKMPAERTGFDKELIKLDEKINILYQLFNYQMLDLFPLEGDPDNSWYSPGDDLSVYSGKDSMFVANIMVWYLSEIQDCLANGNWQKADEIVDMIRTYQGAKMNPSLDIDQKRLDMEIKYNQLNPFRTCKKLYLILGGILLILTFSNLFQSRIWISRIIKLLWLAVLGAFIYQMIGMGMRWYIGGYAPWSNSYETMVYVAWAAVTGGLLFARRSPVTFALATLFAGIILFVSGLNWMDPQIKTLVPVLKSPWLMFHVAVIVAAYGFFGISFLIGITNLVMMAFRPGKKMEVLALRIRELSIANEMSLIVGLALMTIGTFLGAVWANESWGRYWGWDPKETWALITMIIYAIVTHIWLVKKWSNAWTFNFASVISFASVLMTYFGVNYFLSGMHSYGNNDQAGGIFAYLYIVIAVVVLLALMAYRGYKKITF